MNNAIKRPEFKEKFVEITEDVFKVKTQHLNSLNKQLIKSCSFYIGHHTSFESSIRILGQLPHLTSQCQMHHITHAE